MDTLKRVLFADDRVNEMHDVIIAADMMRKDMSREEMKIRGVKEALRKKEMLAQFEETKRRMAAQEERSDKEDSEEKEPDAVKIYIATGAECDNMTKAAIMRLKKSLEEALTENNRIKH